MEISDVRKRVLRTVDEAKRRAAARRTRIDQAEAEYAVFLDRVAVPIVRQVANVLRAEGFAFSVSTPAGAVRLMSDRSAEDYMELSLDTSGSEPRVVGHSSRGRGRRVVETELPLGADRAIPDLTEEDVLEFLLKSLEPLVE